MNDTPTTVRKHHGSLKSSQRQQAILRNTSRGVWYSAMDLVQLAGIPNPGEAISALRANGVKIEKRYFVSETGARFCKWKIG